MMGEDFGNLHQAIAAAALDFLCDLRVQYRARFREQALVERAYLNSVALLPEAGRQTPRFFHVLGLNANNSSYQG
jgi:hypothetical protein